MKGNKFNLLSASVALALFLNGCATGGEYEKLGLTASEALQPAFQVPAAGEATNITVLAAEDVVANWWENLGDEKLGELIEAALEHNNDVRLALANLELARIGVDDASLGRIPAIDARFSAADQRLPNMPGIPGAGARFNRYEAGFDVSWELDLFGRIGYGIDAAGADLAASEAALDDTYVTVAAEVARTYIRLRGTQHRLDVNQRHAGNLEQSLELTRDLLEGGFGNTLDVQRALGQWELVKAGIPALRSRIDADINRLGVLTGRMPASLRESLAVATPLPSIPPSVNVGEPLDLLKRRPDIRRAENELNAAIARYDMSVAALYPRVSITGSIGFLATAFADLGTGGGFSQVIGPGISWEVFDRARVTNRVDAADARVQAQLASFEKTLLTSFEEVDNTMNSLAREGERRASLLAAAEASAEAANLAQERFDAGTDSYLDVLDAQRTRLEAEDLLAQSETELSLNLIALYKALGGGWELARQ